MVISSNTFVTEKPPTMVVLLMAECRRWSYCATVGDKIRNNVSLFRLVLFSGVFPRARKECSVWITASTPPPHSWRRSSHCRGRYHLCHYEGGGGNGRWGAPGGDTVSGKWSPGQLYVRALMKLFVSPWEICRRGFPSNPPCHPCGTRTISRQVRNSDDR